MNPLPIEDIATRRHALDLAHAAAYRDSSLRSPRPAMGARLGRLLVGAGSRLLARAEA